MKTKSRKIGSLVMNNYHGICRLGVIQEMITDSQGWTNYYIEFFEDQTYEASHAHRLSLLHEVQHKEVYRSDEVTLIDPEWLNDVLESYGEYQNER